MIIRASQYKELSEQTKLAFVKRISGLLGSKFPEERYEVPDDEWLAGIRRRVDRALKYGIPEEEDIFTFLMMDYRFGEHFEKSPEYKGAMEILQHRTLTGKRKVEKLHDLLFDVTSD